jgi:alpha-glucosidase
MLRSRSVLCLFALLLPLVARAQPDSQVLKSPDGRLALTLETIEAINKPQPSPIGQLVYSVTFKGKPLLDRSSLALNLQGQHPLGSGVKTVSETPSQADETYRLIAGKASTVRNHYNALRIDLEEASSQENFGMARKFSIEARAYDDAIAFRYLVPDQTAIREFRLLSEATEFRLSKDATTYALLLPHFRTQYESEYVQLNASAFANQDGLSKKVLIGLPLLLHLPGVAWAAITEANLRGNSSMYLVNPETNWGGRVFESRIAPGDDPDVVTVGTLPHHSAWRVLLVGDDPGTLIESNVITSLNPKSAVADTSWIHPGLTAWDWWSGSLDSQGHPSFTTANMKYYVDFAAKSGLPYMLVDAGWSPIDDITKMNGRVDIPELVRYAAPKHVKIWIWMHYKAVDAQMDEAFPLFEKWGVAGLKIDFVQRDDQRGIDFYYRAAAKAAEHHLMVDFHGATKPTGMERTYPNVMGYEGVLGMEQSHVGMRDNPHHRVMIPFTRMLAGPMDYTPGGFDNVTESDFVPRSTHPMVMGTRAQQLAMYVVYQAAFQMVSDSPKAYEDQPAFDFIKHAPATWDETKVLNGQPGEYVTVARRSGRDWFLGSMTNWDARALELSLDFLGPGRYTAEIYADAPDAGQYPKGVSVTKQTVERGGRLTANLAPGGGYAVRFVPKIGTQN